MALPTQSKPRLWGDAYLPRYRSQEEKEEEAKRNGKKLWGDAYKSKFLPQGDCNEEQIEARDQLPSKEDEERRNSLEAQMALLKENLQEKLKEARAQQQRKLEELLQPIREEEDYDSGDCIISFELAGLVKQKRFEGLKREDPRGHVISFLKLCDKYVIAGLSKDRVRRILFPISLTGRAKLWHARVCGAEEQTFVTTCEMFINQFCEDQRGPKLDNPTESPRCSFLFFPESEQIKHPPSNHQVEEELKMQEAPQVDNRLVKDEMPGIFLEAELMQNMENPRHAEEYCSNNLDVFDIEVQAFLKSSKERNLDQAVGSGNEKKLMKEAENVESPAMLHLLTVVGNLEGLVKQLLERNQVLEKTIQQQAMELKIISEKQTLSMEAWRNFKAAGKQVVQGKGSIVEEELKKNVCSREQEKLEQPVRNPPQAKKNNKKKKKVQGNTAATKIAESKEVERANNPVEGKKVDATPGKIKEFREVIISRALNEIRKGMKPGAQQQLRHERIKENSKPKQKQYIDIPHALINMLMNGERQEIQFRGRKFKLKKDPVVPPDLT